MVEQGLTVERFRREGPVSEGYGVDIVLLIVGRDSP